MLSRYRPHHPAAARYGVAVLAVALAAALRVAFNAVWGPRQPFTTFYAAVVIAVWYGGVGPGLLAVLLSACAAAFFWFEPLYSLRVATPADWLALALFALVALLVVFITGAMHRARRHAEQARQELAEQGARYRRIVETASEGIWEVDAGLRLTYANWQLAAMLGYTPEEMTGRSAYDFTFAEDRALFERRVEERRRGLTGHHDLRLRRKDGSELWVRSVSTPITGARGEFAGAFSVLTDISRERQVERRLRLLSAAGETLAASLAIEVVLQNLARLCVPEFADQCVVDLLNADGVPELAAVARIDAAREEKLRELRRRYPPNPARPSPLWEAIRENKPILLAELDEAVVEAAFENEEHRALAREMMAKSAVIAPLSVNGRVLGALSLSITDSDRRFNEDDLALAADLARRAAAAVHNALLHRAAEQAEAAAQRHAARLQILDENARLLASAGLSLDRILEAATRRVAELIGDICSIYFIEEDGEHFTPAVIYHRDPEMAEELRQADRARRTRVDESFSARVVETGEALLIPEITPEDALTGVSPKYRDYLRRRPVYGILIAPLKSRGRVTGLLSLTRTSPGRPYTEDDRRLLQELADRTALAVENARLHAGAVEAEERARQQAARMAMLAEVSKAITEAGFDQQALFEAITRRVAEVMGDSCVLRLLSEDRQPLPIKAFWNSDPEKHAQLAELFAAEPPGIIPLYQRIIESGQPLFISQDAAQELRPLMHPAQAAVGEQFGVSAAQFVPLRVSGEVVGVLTCSRSGRPYTAEEQALFQELADRASVAIEKARLFAEVQEANRRKDEFLAMLGHELRNPIAAMLNAHRAATARGGEGTRAQAHEILDRQLSHLARLVDDLLDVSRITRGKVLLRREPVELTGLLRETCEDLREQAERSGLALGLECADEGEPVWVNGDRTRLAQMLTNLVTNAIKFTNEGGRITVRAGRDGDSAHVSVRDTGIGIEPQMLARVFDTFAQADRSLDRSRGGLGLGLALVKGLAELHGGEVAAHSDGVGLGAEFSFRLPLIAPPEAEPEIEWGTRPAFDAAGGGFDGGLGDGWMPAFAPSRLPEAAAPAAAAGPLRVLVIDDNRDSADMACLILQLHGHAAEAVYSGAKGLEAVERVRPDAVCCDIGLPEMDGYEVARELRRRGYAGLLIAVSGYGQEEDKRRSREAGFDAHLVKPVEPEQLARALRETPRRSA
jgi:PAS domain S-box-containing protein